MLFIIMTSNEEKKALTVSLGRRSIIGQPTGTNSRCSSCLLKYFVFLFAITITSFASECKWQTMQDMPCLRLFSNYAESALFD